MSWPRFWQTSCFSWLGWLLRPLGAVVCRIARRRFERYRQSMPASQASCPVLVVGNVTVGGSGKTPFIQWLGQGLQQRGWRIGVVSRGYGGEAKQWPQWVTPDSDPKTVGDEPLLLAQTLQCPVAVAPKRVEAVRCLQERAELDLIISDDGLQHFAMARDLEVVIVDGVRGFGNQRCLPAGPLREPLSRLRTVDWVVNNGPFRTVTQDGVTAHHPAGSAAQLTLSPAYFYRVNQPEVRRALDAFANESVTALAGIGHPARFFETLRPLVGEMDAHPFADHQAYRPTDFQAMDPQKPLIMTAKDAVKCEAFAQDNWWALAVKPHCPTSFLDQIEQRLVQIRHSSSSEREKA
ncbi:tetraacyldisaccharide 4'-kinase [Thiomicrospira sp. WB1]|uniref:tetraacyldisaccharide 4'-kinase n=1 Tax=Thiomicrospira sp. WB1 TaxID=1685380 RepID=UPI00074751AD|nr:tetraacyldisaccharide 4'-kinase [Thiomicrospira sp. WB1]KUJ72845.1 hypothetical protein AVO41_03445 [Thiomicrospira sp. WB1]